MPRARHLNRPSTLALILAGGRVDELGPLTAYRPKSAVPFGGFARVIDFALSNLMHSGLERVAILSQYRCFSLINHIGTGAAWDMIGRHRGISILPPFQGSVSTSWYKGSADAVYQNLDFVRLHEPEEILVLSGDHIYRMDYRPLIEYHREKQADCTIACIQVPFEAASRFGLAAIDDEDGEVGGRVLRYVEKPATPEFNWASLTVYCFRPQVLYEALEYNAVHDESHEFGRDVLPRLLADGRRVYGYKFQGYWGYTRTIEEYWRTSMDLLGPTPAVDLAAWGIRTNLENRNIRDCQPALVRRGAKVVDSLVYNGCIVEGTVERSILFPGVHVRPGAVVRDSVLFFDTVVGRGCRLERLISDVNNVFDAEVAAGRAGGPVTVIGWNNHLPAGLLLPAGISVPPECRPDQLPAVLHAHGGGDGDL